MIPGPDTDPYLVRVDKVNPKGMKEQIAVFYARAATVDSGECLQVVSGQETHTFPKGNWSGFEIHKKYA